MNYYLILGKNPNLSLAEAKTVLPKLKIEEFIKESLIFTIPKADLDCQKLQKKLGGTKKIGQILAKISIKNNIFSEIKKIIFQEAENKEKFYFGFSLYNLDDQKLFDNYQKQILRWGISLKKELLNKVSRVRFVTAKTTDLSAVIIKKNHLLSNEGLEFVLFLGKEFVYFGKTLTIQDFEDYSARDYGRPNRDDLSGMIPPKLAQMMINLGQIPLQATILDPFCGSGTILQEAILLGYQNLIGADKEQKAISDSGKNLSWLKENYPKNNFSCRLLLSEVKNLNQKIAPKTIDAVITEPFLGPPLKKFLSEKEIQPLKQELENLYTNALQTLSSLLKPKGIIVIIFPIFQTKTKLIKLELENQIKKFGLLEKKEELIYQRPEQKIFRQIKIYYHKQ